MERTWGRRQVLTLARPAVQATAPDEVWLLDATYAAYSRWQLRRGRPTHTEDMLGFGLDESVPAMTLVALGAAQAAVAFLAVQFGAAVREESSELVKDWVHGLFGRLRRSTANGEGDEALPSDTVPLSPEVLKRVRDVVRRQARDLGATPEHAALMADAIVGRLTVGEVQELGPE